MAVLHAVAAQADLPAYGAAAGRETLVLSVWAAKDSALKSRRPSFRPAALLRHPRPCLQPPVKGDHSYCGRAEQLSSAQARR